MKFGKGWISAGLAVGFLALYLNGLAAVPFHPDESTWIYMSHDFDVVLLQRRPQALAWTPEIPLSPEMELRLLNAPVAKYLMGLSWWMHGYTAADLNGDWVWNDTWDANRQAGHLPSPGLLLAGRLPGAVLAALAHVLIFWIGSEVGGAGLGLAAALLLAFNPLMLLHTRRAMAEGVAYFFSALAVWGSLRLARAGDALAPNPWRWLSRGMLLGAAVGLAMASKQTGAVLLPVALAAAGLPVLQRAWPLPLRLQTLGAVWLAIGVGSGLSYWALNPVLYRHPLGAAQAMVRVRNDLAQRQTETNASFNPESLTPSPGARLRAALLEVYLRPPAIWDLPVYVDHLAPQAEAYLASPLNNLLRWPILGALLAGMSTAGVVLSTLRLMRDRLTPATRAEQIVWSWFVVVFSLILMVIPFDWQRYFLPLVPPAFLFAALGLAALARPVVGRMAPGRRA